LNPGRRGTPPDAGPRGAGFLDLLERVGNRLPNPATLFLGLAALVVIASSIGSRLGLEVTHPRDGSLIAPIDLLTREGVRRMFTDAVRNFVGFAPLGTVLVAMLGIGVAEGTGLVAAAMRAFVLSVPRPLLTAAIIFTGVMANQAADAGVIILPPLGGLLFAAAGRHPLAGVAAAFAGVAGGFSANLLPSTLDVLMTGFTQEAVEASRLAPEYRVQMLGNWYFMAAATPILTVVGTWITDRVVEPRLGAWRGTTGGAIEPVAPGQLRGLAIAGAAFLATLVALALLVLLPNAPLRVESASRLDALRPLFDSMVLVVMLVFLVPGIAYGVATRTLRSDHDVMKLTTATMAGMAGYIVLAFCIAQFVSWFAWSNLGAIVAISGARGLQALHLEGTPLLVGLVGFAALLNLMITSASALWAIIAPIFVPMFMLLGFTPEATQCVFRIGESATNIVTPLMPYVPFVLATMERYTLRAGIGTLMAMMLPYAIAFLVSWTALLVLFDLLGWPIGPGVRLRMP
jgi:aminobenzoyl-glutamate transport protein